MLRGILFSLPKVRVVSKTVQVFIPDVSYLMGHPYEHDKDGLPPQVPRDPPYVVMQPELVRLARRIELAAQMRVLGRWSSTMFQVTNYGLSGLCESHIDPHGAIEGVEVNREARDTSLSSCPTRASPLTRSSGARRQKGPVGVG